jgi:hypothetical protein
VRTAKALLWIALVAGLLAGPARGDEAPAGANGTAPPSPSVAHAAPVAVATPEGSDEPSLQDAQAAAARLAAGDAAGDASRVARARAAHWAPVVRGQLGGTTSEQTRDGVMYLDPLHWTNLGSATTWAVTLTWDLPSAIYARDENQLALSSVHLARVRREVVARTGLLYGSRKRKLAALRAQAGASPATQLESALSLLETTAGLFAPALARVQARVDALSRSLHLEELP